MVENRTVVFTFISIKIEVILLLREESYIILMKAMKHHNLLY